MSERRAFPTDLDGISPHGGSLSGYRWDGDRDRTIVLLHAGICDSRSWEHLAPELTDFGAVLAYDRPGHGSTPPTDHPRDHVADAIGFLDANVSGPAWLIGSSMGGAVALDVAITHPDRVAGLVLLAPGVTGSPVSTPSERERWLDGLIEGALAHGDLEEANRYEIWFWLDGPAQSEGRVGGAARVLALEMNRTILARTSEADFDESVDAWSRLDELRLPVTVAVGEFDAPSVLMTGRHLGEHIRGASHVELAHTAHLPYLDTPQQTIKMIQTALG